MSNTAPQITQLVTHRLRIALPGGYDAALTRFDQLVPAADMSRFGQLATWDAVKELAVINAPYGFMTYWTSNVTALMAGSPSDWRCVSYLLGNHVIAEKMFHHNAETVLHSPLQALICNDPQGQAQFVVDRPSDLLAGYDSPEITAVGREFNRLLAGLIHELGGVVPELLTS